MNKQEKIREGMAKYIKLVGNKPDVYTPQMCAEDLLEYLHSQGVVTKVDRELPHKMPECPNNEWSAGYCCGEESMQDIMVEAGYVATELLVEVCPKCGVEPHLCKCPTINRGSFAKYVEEE